MLCPIIYHARRAPDSPAVIAHDKTFTYRDIARAIEGKTEQLEKEGVKKGQHLAIIGHKTVETVIHFWALQRLGAVTCILRHDLPNKTLQKHLRRARAEMLVLSPLSHREVVPRYFERSQPSTLLFTSGSSGPPKIAMHSFENHFSSAISLLTRIPFTSEDTWLCKVPLYHVAGLSLLFRCFFLGASLSLCEEAPYSHVSLVPAQMNKTDCLERAKAILLGGDKMATEKFSPLPIYSSYGMTEMSSTITINRDLLPFRSLKIHRGEIYVKGAPLFLGYFSADSPLSLPLDDEGYFPTGDLGRYTREEGLTFLGRKDRMFISGGENIQPEEIEKELEELPEILQCKIVSVPHEIFGRRPVAFILTSQNFDENEIKKKLSSTLPKWKIPDRILPMPDAGWKYSQEKLTSLASASLQKLT